MKYRALTLDELEALKDEFIRFLIVQGLDALEWQKIKEIDPKKSLSMIEAFSDFIWEGIVSKVQFIDYFDGKALKLFKCDPTQIHLLNLECDAVYDDMVSFFAALSQDMSPFYIQKATKLYQPDRGVEVFRMIENGGIISNGEWFHKFS